MRIQEVPPECSPHHCHDSECPYTHSTGFLTPDGETFNTKAEALAADKRAHPEEYMD